MAERFMKLRDVAGWQATTYAGHWPPVSHTTDWSTMVTQCGESLEMCRADDDGDVYTFIPLAVLANHLRLMGWTVTPPDPKPQGDGS